MPSGATIYGRLRDRRRVGWYSPGDVTSSDAAALKALFEPAWAAIRASGPRLGWGMRLTPLFPEPWPDPTEIVVFAYACGLAIGVSDGENVSGPFAVAHLRAGSGPRVEGLSGALEKLGVQGIRPLRGDEIELMRASAAIQEELAGSPGTLSERVIAYYRHWLGVSGVIAASLPESQQRFFAAVRGTTRRSEGTRE
jgi:hypothetical protein